jgi:hypothetical protein
MPGDTGDFLNEMLRKYPPNSNVVSHVNEGKGNS